MCLIVFFMDNKSLWCKLADEEEVSLVSLNEPLPSSSEWTNKDLMDFVSYHLTFIHICHSPMWFSLSSLFPFDFYLHSFYLDIQAGWLGGSYVSTELDPMNGELIVPLSNNAQLKLDMSKVLFYFILFYSWFLVFCVKLFSLIYHFIY